MQPNEISTIQPLLQKALNLMETAACWERKAAKKAHIVGLQGEKRRLRYLSREAQNIVDWIEHCAWDQIKDDSGKGLDICAQQGTVDVKNLTDTQTTMTGIIEKLWTIYNQAHQLSNDLVAAKFAPFSIPLVKYYTKLFYILGELQRADIEYGMASYEYHHVSRYQVEWYNIHDDYERKEEWQGYMYGIA